MDNLNYEDRELARDLQRRLDAGLWGSLDAILSDTPSGRSAQFISDALNSGQKVNDMEDFTGAGKIAEQIPELTKELRELVFTLLSPAAQELGGLAGDYIQRIRQRNRINGLQKTLKILQESGLQIQAVRPGIFLPIIEGMSLEDEENLQGKWANLLASAALGNEPHPGYLNTLKSLSPLDARILDVLYEIRNSKEPWTTKQDLTSLTNVAADKVDENTTLLQQKNLIHFYNDIPKGTDSTIRLSKFGKMFMQAVTTPKIQ